MDKLRQNFPNYNDLPENIRWIVDRLEQLQALQQLEDKQTQDEFWLETQRLYKERFDGDIVEDIQKFGKEYL